MWFSTIQYSLVYRIWVAFVGSYQLLVRALKQYLSCFNFYFCQVFSKAGFSYYLLFITHLKYINFQSWTNICITFNSTIQRFSSSLAIEIFKNYHNQTGEHSLLTPLLILFVLICSYFYFVLLSKPFYYSYSPYQL